MYVLRYRVLLAHLTEVIEVVLNNEWRLQYL